jgi:putative flavoprotein involved in K+ transport
MKDYDVVIIGGGQSALATAYYLRRTDLRFILLDMEEQPGGAWQYTWESLNLFSPALWSSLPGVIMPGGPDHYPTRAEALQYLQQYEERYKIPVKRPVQVYNVQKHETGFILDTSDGLYRARAVVSATGTYRNPYTPQIPGREKFRGEVLHSARYRSPEGFAGKRVIVAGEGNSGAQILAELSKTADTLWVTNHSPQFLPDDIDGRYLFDAATRQYEARRQGKSLNAPSLGHIVMLPAVKDARERGVLEALPAFDHFTETGVGWHSGRQERADAVIFCTGFRPALAHLKTLGILNAEGRVDTEGTRAKALAGLWLVGYGQWTGFASATLIGVGRTGRQTAEEIGSALSR